MYFDGFRLDHIDATRFSASGTTAPGDRCCFSTAIPARTRRWAYVAYRAALDHPRRITHLAVLDGVPIGEALARCGPELASR
jgi:hypothetical protein